MKHFKLIAAFVLLVALILNIQYALTDYNGINVSAQNSNTVTNGTSTSGYLGNETYSSCAAVYDKTYNSGVTLTFTYQAGISVTNLSLIGSASGSAGATFTYVSTSAGRIQAQERNCPYIFGSCSHLNCGQF